MKLKDYLDTLTPEERKAFAAQCDTKIGYLSQLTCRVADGAHQRLPSPKKCRLFVAASNGKLRLEDLRPDIWGDLRHAS